MFGFLRPPAAKPSEPESAPATSGGPGLRLDLAAIGRALGEGLQHGRHLGTGRGDGGEFYDFRSYTAGDSSRLIDWRLLGRTDRAYLRRYRQESQLNLLIIVDSSASMNYGGLRQQPRMTKFRRATEFAAALAYAAIRGGDRVGAILAGATASRAVLEIGAGWGAYHRVLHMLEQARPEASAAHTPQSSASTGAVAIALDDAARVLPRSGLLIVLSDGLEEPESVAQAAARLRSGGGSARLSVRSAAGTSAPKRAISFVQVLADDELDLDIPGLAATLVDPESGHSAVMNSATASEFGPIMHAHIAQLRAGLIGAGARHILAPLSRDPGVVLREVTTLRPPS